MPTDDDDLAETSALMDSPSMYFGGDEEELFPTPATGGDNILQFNEQHWQSSDDMTGTGSSVQPWQVESAEMSRNDSSATNQSNQSNSVFNFTAGSPAQTTKLSNVELPIRSSSSPSNRGSMPNDDSNSPARDMRSRKRKSSPLTEEDDDEPETPETPPSRPPPKKTAHNMIEKRYRTNLNDKIAALRKSVPSLRATEKSMQGKGNNNTVTNVRHMVDMMEDLDGLVPPNKLNKATILSKATEYIDHLERRNKALAAENAALRERIRTFEALILGRKLSGANMYHPDQLMMHHHQEPPQP
ncbi:hypothetical protein V494_00053 [Pseudogymnoascus sp. VKM F-4513 (FW-928)]|nr:hypothetical protein V494_00053 [Pseudogymnoascus sp. VKM F-4513 (FW-928)]